MDKQFLNKLVRQAMNYAVDTQAITDNIFNENAEQVAGVIVPGELGYDSSIKPYPYDPKKAKDSFHLFLEIVGHLP